MTYLEKIKNDYENRIISFQKLKTMEESYKSSNEKEKIELRYEEYEKELVLKNKELVLKNYYNDVKGIRKNVQFFFWLFIIGVILSLFSLILS